MWELDHKEGWALKNWCFQTVVLEKTQESPWTARRSNQSTLKEINPEYSLEGLMLKLQYFGHVIRKANSLEKTESQRRGQQRMRWLDSTTDSMDMNPSKLWKTVKHSYAWCAAVHEVAKSETWLRKWTTNWTSSKLKTSLEKTSLKNESAGTFPGWSSG